MPGINPKDICHRLAIRSNAKPMAQKKRKLEVERQEAALEETKKLLKAEFNRKILFITWLVNMLMVKKSSGKS